MGDSPEAVRERVKAEELAKGVDPRVAEGRAKAAEVRAKHGLPIDPQEAWRAKLAQEGGGTDTATATAPPPEAPAPDMPEPAEQAPAPAEVAPAAPQTAPAEVESPEPPPAPATAPTAPVARGTGAAESAAAAAQAGAPAPPPTPATAPAGPPPPAAEPEIGQPVEVSVAGLEVIAGIPVRDNPVPAWLLAVLLVIAAWALSYLIFFAGGNLENASQCTVQPDHTFVCFEAETEGEGAGGH